MLPQSDGLGAGALIAGKYRVDRVLGVGGMGKVVSATHIDLNQVVALKVMLPELVSNHQLVQRFLQEARSAVRLRSEHVCRISDVGTHDRVPFIVMEYLEGSDLASVREAAGVLQPQVAADYVLQACEAIAEAHALGIVHRDLKPANLFVTSGADGSPLVKVLDFGIAKALGSADLNMTRTSTVMGSPGYMSPEQLRSSKHVDARSDLWSVGVILYELVTGVQPFHAETLTELCLKITMEPPAPMPRTKGGPNLAAFETVVRRCLEKDPKDRYPDVGALAVELARLAPAQAAVHVDRIQRILQGERSKVTGAPGGAARLATFNTMSKTRSRRGLVIAGVILGVGLFAGVGLVATRGGSETPARPPAPVVTPLPVPPAATIVPPTVVPAVPPPVAPMAVAPTNPDAGAAAPAPGREVPAPVAQVPAPVAQVPAPTAAPPRPAPAKPAGSKPTKPRPGRPPTADPLDSPE